MMNMKGFLGKTMYGKVIESAEDFAQLFLEKGLVATVPCTAFAAPGFVRWSYATSLTEIDKGLDRLERLLRTRKLRNSEQHSEKGVAFWFLHRTSGALEPRRRFILSGRQLFSAPAERGTRTAAGVFALSGRQPFLHRLSGVLELR